MKFYRVPIRVLVVLAVACMGAVRNTFAVEPGEEGVVELTPTHFSTPEMLGQTEVRRLVSRLFRDEATAADECSRNKARLSLCDLYAAIRLHPKYDESEMLRAESVRVRRRLISTSDQLADKLRRDGVLPPADLKKRSNAAALAATEAGSEGALAYATEAGPSAATKPFRAIRPTPSNAQGPAGLPENGWELVELIQRTIHPDFWEVRGGAGSVQYFAARRVLVVRATTQVHEDLVELLRQL